VTAPEASTYPTVPCDRNIAGNSSTGEPDIENLIKTPRIYSVPYFNWGIGAFGGRLSALKPPVATGLTCDSHGGRQIVCSFHVCQDQP